MDCFESNRISLQKYKSHRQVVIDENTIMGQSADSPRIPYEDEINNEEE